MTEDEFIAQVSDLMDNLKTSMVSYTRNEYKRLLEEYKAPKKVIHKFPRPKAKRKPKKAAPRPKKVKK